MEITIEISGGFAPVPALSRPITIDTAAADPQVGRHLEALVHGAAFFDRPASIDTTGRGAADYRTYMITIRDGSRVHTVRLTDPIADSSLAQLVSAIEDAARRARR